MDGEPKEIELKLRVTPEDIVVLQNHPKFSGAFHNSSRETLRSVYFDSDKRVLRDHGLTLRVRHIGDKRIQTIKAADPGTGCFERSEWEQAIEGDRPDLALVKDTALGPILTDDIRNTLNPVFETRIERTACRLNGGGADIVLAVDHGEIVAAGSARPVSEIELELEHGNPTELFKIAREIMEMVPAQLEVKSKSERGYDLLESRLITAETAVDPKLRVGMSAGRAFTLIGRACLRHLVANEPGVMSRDGNALHQMRVALRRLRAAISVFSEIVNDDRVSTIKTELRWLTREFGPARDFDTFLVEVLRPLQRQLSNEPGFVSIKRMFVRKRLKSYRQAQETVQSARFRSLILDAAEWVETGSWSTSEDAQLRARREMPIEIYASEQLSRRCKKIKRLGAKIGDLTAEQLHRLRIQVKKARYAVEFFSGVYPGKKSAKQCKRIQKALMRLQNYLGGINDIVTRKALLADTIANPARGLSGEQSRHRAFAAGLIVGDQQARFQNLINCSSSAYARFVGAKAFWKLPRRPGDMPSQQPSSESQL